MTLFRPIVFACLLLLSCSTQVSLAASDVLLVNGNIYTANPSALWAQAIAITGSRIDAVGSNEAVMAFADAASRIIDLQSRTVIPGLVDSHAHMWLGGLALQGINLATPEIYIEPADSDRFLAHIREFATSHPEEKVLYGRALFPRTVNRTQLDAAVPDRPLLIHAPTEHSLWVNSKALELAGITTEPHSDPMLEAYIIRDTAGEPTGVLLEGAMQLMEPVTAIQDFETRVAWLSNAAQYLNRFGITSVVNATGNLDEIRAYAALRDRGELTVRTRTSFGTVAVNHQLSQRFLDQLEEARTLQDAEWVGANLIKFFADGAGGPPLYQPEDFQALVLELDRRGYQIMTHSLTAVTTRTVLDAYEHAIKTNGPRDRRFRIEHASNVPVDEIPRFAALGVTASMQAEFCCNDQPGLSNAWQSLLKAGVNLVFGSDWPCTFPPDPFTAIQQSLERTVRPVFAPYTPFPEKIAGTPQESLTVEQAVDAYTRSAAHAAYMDENIGTLEAGKLADLAVLTQDIFNVPTTSIGNTQVVLTMVGGTIVFDQMKIRH